MSCDSSRRRSSSSIGAASGRISLDVKVSGEQSGVLALLQRAERQNARQQRRAPFQRLREFGRERPRGALGRHIDRGARHRQRRRVAREAGNDLAVEQGRNERLQKRRAGRDGEKIARDERASRSAPARGDRPFGVCDRRDRADVKPKTAGDDAIEPPLARRPRKRRARA